MTPGGRPTRRAPALPNAANLARSLRSRTEQGGAERGAFAALELVILTPFVLVMLLLVVGFGRVERGRELVDQATQAAARAASLAPNPATARAAGRQAAAETLRNGGLSCLGGDVNPNIDISAFGPGGSVTARVTCTVSLSDLTPAGFGHTTLTSTSTSTIGQYQQTGGTG